MISFPATVTCDNPGCRSSIGIKIEHATSRLYRRDWPRENWIEFYLPQPIGEMRYDTQHVCSEKCKEQLTKQYERKP